MPSIPKKNDSRELIRNYQVSHIFGRTKNPFLFTAPWNIVWKPKLLDPLTGHESKGDLHEKYKAEFLSKSREKYSDFIFEYNQKARLYFSKKCLTEAFSEMQKSIIDTKKFERFKQDAQKELALIEIA